MLTLEDCFEICGLNRDEIRYFVDHEHISELRVAELAEKYIVLDDSGAPRLRRRIVEDIQELNRQHRPREAHALENFVRDFVVSHPQAKRLYF